MEPLNDLMVAFYATATGETGTLDELRRSYYISTATLDEGLDVSSAEHAFYQAQLLVEPSDNIDDLRLAYFEQETGQTGPIDDLMWAYFNS